ncbi:DUF4377 domain-containing protein [Deinococcus sp. SM5_A1]|uniref:DUF4377 domain-containing protein n=1 Tax=Deinococcus sp. SM5_A1 TaxID=3379094 RepID=UPI00385C57A4
MKGRNFIGLSLLFPIVLSACNVSVQQDIQLVVAPKKVACETLGDKQCFLVKTSRDGKSFTAWFISSQPIEGFNYEAGFRYRLSVTDYGYLPGVTGGPNIPSYYYLKEVIEKVADDSTYLPGYQSIKEST